MKSFFQCVGLFGMASAARLPTRATPPSYSASPPSYSEPSPSCSPDSPPTVEIKNGTVQGLHRSDYNQDYFLGIPFAQPPVDTNRFRNPQSMDSTFSEPFEATEYAPACYGYGSDQIGYPQSEDCLYLNVVRPSGFEHQDLPVGVWIHGGGLYQGSSRDERYNLTFIVENSVKIGKPIMAVSIGYRLAVWGFLQSAEITEAGQTNMGLRDQRLALHWIQENIKAFGGDKEKVTIWGESAGAASVGWHLTAYNGRDDGLFRAGIMESGNPVNYNGYYNNSHYQPQYDALATAVGCNGTDSLDCMRSLPVEEFVKAFNATPSLATGYNPIIDNDFIQRPASAQLADGSFVHVPIIDGANSDEGTAFGPASVNSTDDFLTYLSNTTASSLYLPAALAEDVVDVYPNEPSYWIPEVTSTSPISSTSSEQRRRAAAYAGDATMIANRRGACETWAREGLKAYSYRFDTVPAGLPGSVGATHFQEVAFVFDNTDGLGYNAAHGTLNPFNDGQKSYIDLAELMSSTWASFIHDLDPNGFKGRYPGADVWPLYSLEDPKNIVWAANATELGYVEDDVFRKEGIKWILDHAEEYRR